MSWEGEMDCYSCVCVIFNAWSPSVCKERCKQSMAAVNGRAKGRWSAGIYVTFKSGQTGSAFYINTDIKVLTWLPNRHIFCPLQTILNKLSLYHKSPLMHCRCCSVAKEKKMDGVTPYTSNSFLQVNAVLFGIADTIMKEYEIYKACLTSAPSMSRLLCLPLPLGLLSQCSQWTLI